MFGQEYKSIQSIILVSSFSLVPLFMGSVQEIWIAHHQKTSIVLKKVIIGIPISAALFVIFIKYSGIHGASIAMATSYYTTAFAINYYFDNNFFKLQLRAIGISYGK